MLIVFSIFAIAVNINTQWHLEIAMCYWNFIKKKSLLLLIDEKDVIVKFVDRVDNFKQLSKEERRKLFEGL